MHLEEHLKRTIPHNTPHAPQPWIPTPPQLPQAASGLSGVPCSPSRSAASPTIPGPERQQRFTHSCRAAPQRTAQKNPPSDLQCTGCPRRRAAPDASTSPPLKPCLTLRIHPEDSPARAFGRRGYKHGRDPCGPSAVRAAPIRSPLHGCCREAHPHGGGPGSPQRCALLAQPAGSVRVCARQ